jgi:hypothetical protein
MTRHASLVAAVAAVVTMFVAAGACSSEPAPMTGAGGTTGAAGGGGGTASCTPTGGTGSPGTAIPGPNFATVRNIAASRCGVPGCHVGAMQPPLQDTPDFYATLTSYRSSSCSGFRLVEPCKPEESAFYLAQMGQCPNIPRMPLECTDNCTPADWLEHVRNWIANGAKP